MSVCFLEISISQAKNQDPPLIGGAAHRSNSYSGMQPGFRSRLDALYSAMPSSYRRGFGVTSGYRSEATQNRLRHSPHKRGYVAMGRSHHTIGDAADLHGRGIQWAHRHAHQFGLYFPMGYEPWHIQSIASRNGHLIRHRHHHRHHWRHHRR